MNLIGQSMPSEKLISVLMSVFNNEITLEKSISSILNQSYTNFEFLIIDDFSTDSSVEIIKKYEKQDSRIKLFFNKENIGLTKSLNILIQKSKGDFIARQDGDDISKLNRFDKQIYSFKKNNIEFCVSRAEIHQTGYKIPNWSFYVPKKILINYKNPFIHGTLMIKKETILKIYGYDENFYYSQDYKLFKDLLSLNVKYKYLNESLYVLNMENNISKTKHVEQKYYSDCVKNNLIPKKVI